MAENEPATDSFGGGGNYPAVDNFVWQNWLQHHQAVESHDDAAKNGRTIYPLVGETPAN